MGRWKYCHSHELSEMGYAQNIRKILSRNRGYLDECYKANCIVFKFGEIILKFFLLRKVVK